MDILRNYKGFLNIKESVDSDKELKSLDEVPDEVIESAKKIANDIFDRVKKPTFEFVPGEGLIMKFQVTEQDFNYIDHEEPLTLDITEGAKRKRTFDVTLTYHDSISETFEIQYLVTCDMFEYESDEDEDFDEDDEDFDFEDEYEKPDEDDDDYFDEDIADQEIKKGRIRIQDVDDINDFTDDDDEI